MNSRTKLILAGVAAVALGALLFPSFQRIATSEAHYREMIGLYPIASELAPNHPKRRLWETRKAALQESGYIERRELRMSQSLVTKEGVNAFFAAFRSRFPGVECRVRAAKSDQPVVVVTARHIDFGPLGRIERFVSEYNPEK